MGTLRVGSWGSGFLVALIASGCAPAEEQSDKVESSVRERVHAITNLADAEKEIRAAWRKFNHCANASSCNGYPYNPTSETQFVPGAGTAAAFRRYEESVGFPAVGVYSDLFGAVILPSWKFDAWLALAGQTAEDGSDLFTYIGMPRPDATFERGMIHPSGIAITGHIYSRYLVHADDFGAPLGPETSLGTGARMQEFEGGEIYFKQDLGAFALKNGEVLDTWKAAGGASGPLGFPVAEFIEFEETVPVVNGSSTVYLHPQSARFEAGGVYYYPTTGAYALTGDFLDKFEQEHGGASGFLGFPISGITTVAATSDEFIDFQNGILIKHRFSSGQEPILTFSNFDFFFDKMQGRDDDCALGICGGGEMRPDILVTTPNGTEVDVRLPYKDDNWDPQFHQSWALDNQIPLSQWYADVSVHVIEIDDSSGNDDMGTVTDHYSIENLWGFDEDHATEHRNGSLSVWFNLRNNLPFGDLPFRQERWWAFENFTTDELTYDQYAQTFVDVSSADEWWRDPLNVLLYELAYKGIASNGNCFGMTVESVYSTLGMSAYPQPISQHLPEVAPGDEPDGSTEAQRALINELNVKMGYQLGADFVFYTLGMLASGLTHEPAVNFDLSYAAHLTGNYPLISISEYWGSRGHSVRPYEWDPDLTGASLHPTIKVADPNYPWGDSTADDVIEFTRFPLVSTYQYRDYSGSSWEGARLFFQPLQTYSKQPYTPFGVIGQAIDQLTSLLVGSDATVEQVTDDQGRKLFVESTSGQPGRWDDLVRDDAARVPDLMPIPLFDGDSNDVPAQFFASRADGATHHYDVGLASGVAAGTNYQAVFTSSELAAALDVPGTPGRPERLTAHQINGQGTAVSVRIPAGSNSKAIKMLVSGAEKTRWAELSQMTMAPGQTIKMGLGNGGYDLRIENDGPPTTAVLRVKHGKDKEIVEIGEIQIDSGNTTTEFLAPETTLSLSNEVPGKNGWLVDVPTVHLDAVAYSGTEILGFDWSNDNQQTWNNVPGSPAAFAYETEGESVLWYFATDGDFNAEEPKSYAFKIDTRVPVIDLSTGSGQFTRIDTFVADVTATDPMPGSGIARFEVEVDGVTVVAGAEVDIFWFPLGSHTLSGEAEDFASWVTTDSGQFEVIATLEDLPETIRELHRRNEIPNAGITNSMVKKAENALASKERGRLIPARNQLQALVHEISAQSGKQISSRGADLLVGDIHFILTSL